MDLKLGTVTVETKASIVKQSKLRVRDLLVGARFEGVQLVAMSVYRSSIKAQMKSSKLAVRAVFCACAPCFAVNLPPRAARYDHQILLSLWAHLTSTWNGVAELKGPQM